MNYGPLAIASGINSSTFTNFNVVGFLDRVRMQNDKLTGSLILMESGTSIELMRINAFSGTTVQDKRPRFYADTTTNASLSGTTGAITERALLNGPVNIVVSGNAAAGSIALITFWWQY